MPLKIKWSPKSKATYLKILEYLEENWTHKEVKNFVEKTNKVLFLILKNPEMYPLSKKRNIHKCVLTKQISFYYQVQEKEITLVTFFDNRENPEKHSP